MLRTLLHGPAALALLALCSPHADVSAQSIDGVVINEFVADNDSVGGYQEPSGGFGDWIELYNATEADVDLSGANLTDTLGELDQWAFPDGTVIGAGGYLIVWADDDEDKGQGGIHTNFRLAKGGEDIALSKGGTIVDSHTYGEQEENVSEARQPNGTGDFVAGEPTPDADNGTSSVRETPALRLATAPNPATDRLTVALERGSYRRYRIADVRGATVARGDIPAGARALELSVAELRPGQYTVLLDGGVASARFTRS